VFIALGCAIQWVAERKIVWWLANYIGDIVIVENTDSEKCRRNLTTMKTLAFAWRQISHYKKMIQRRR